ncbi:MAG: AAA family ATPase [Holophagaceae bacterium]
MDEELWKDELEFEKITTTEEEEGRLENMSLNAFCQIYTVGKKGAYRNKITQHRNKDKMVARFYPVAPATIDSPDYPKYCKLQLIRYRPWVEDYNEAGGGADATSEQIIAAWEAFAMSFEERGIVAPHHMQSAINEVSNRLNNDKEYRDAVTGGQGGDLLMDDGGGASQGTGDSEVPPAGEMEFSNLGVDERFGIDHDDDLFLQNEEWNAEFDWAAPTETEPDLTTAALYQDPIMEFDKWRKGSSADLPAGFVDPELNAQAVERSSLNERQRKFMEVLDYLLQDNTVSSTDSGEHGISRCIVLRGRGGTGKSHCMRCLQTERPANEVKALATTGKAATVLYRGSTVFSRSNGLALPVGKAKYSELGQSRLGDLQKKWEFVKVMFVDEMTMLKPQDLHHINLRLQQIKGNHKLFGGIVVVLVGDTAQLPPVGGSPLWAKEEKGMSQSVRSGLQLYKKYFTTVIQLTENNRLLRGDPQVALFDGILNRLADGKSTVEDWVEIKKRSQASLGSAAGWQELGFTDRGVIHLFTTNKEVEQHNLQELQRCNKPILRIMAKNSSLTARSQPAEYFMGLQKMLHLCIDSTVVLTANLWPEMGLSNGSSGVVKAIEFRGVAFNPQVTNRIWDPEILPSWIWVDFGEEYHGPPFFQEEDHRRRGWVPIAPMSATEYIRKANSLNEETSLTRTMVPLRLAWAWTIWKVQGQTVNGKVVVKLGDSEKEHGVTYVAFSRVRRAQDIGIIGGVSYERISDKIARQPKLIA